MASQEDLSGFVGALHKADPRDDVAFHTLLVRGVDLLQLMDKDIARQFGVSRPTVTRWRNGDNAPHPTMRKPVYAWMEQRATTLLRRSEKPAGGSFFVTPMAASGKGD